MENTNGYVAVTPMLIADWPKSRANGVAIVPAHSGPKTNGWSGNGAGVNRFLLCTVIWGVAREVKARGEVGGDSLPLLPIARDVLHSYLQAEASSPGNSILDEAVLEGEIKKRLQELFHQARTQRTEERRLDLESLIAAEQTKRRRQFARG